MSRVLQTAEDVRIDKEIQSLGFSIGTLNIRIDQLLDRDPENYPEFSRLANQCDALRIERQKLEDMLCDAEAEIIEQKGGRGMSAYRSGLLEGQRIIVREPDGSCWVAITERKKRLLENNGADIWIQTLAGDMVALLQPERG